MQQRVPRLDVRIEIASRKTAHAANRQRHRIVLGCRANQEFQSTNNDEQKGNSGGPAPQGRQTREGKMAISKRDFLIGAAATGGALMLGRIDSPGQTGRRVIDAHTHWYPAEWVELVQKEGEAAGARLGRNERGGITFNAAGIGAVFSPNYIDVDSRIKSM